MPTIGAIPSEFWDAPEFRAFDPEVVYLGRMSDTPHDYYRAANLFPPYAPSHAFVYLLLACDGSVLYAGKARTPGQRFDRHRRRDWWDEVALLCLLRVSGETAEAADTAALWVESVAIRRLDPTYNIAGARRRPGFSRGRYV